MAQCSGEVGLHRTQEGPYRELTEPSTPLMTNLTWACVCIQLSKGFEAPNKPKIDPTLGFQGHIEDGHRVLDRDYSMGPIKVPI